MGTKSLVDPIPEKGPRVTRYQGVLLAFPILGAFTQHLHDAQPGRGQLWLTKRLISETSVGDFWNRGRNPLQKPQQTLSLSLEVYSVAYMPTN